MAKMTSLSPHIFHSEPTGAHETLAGPTAEVPAECWAACAVILAMRLNGELAFT